MANATSTAGAAVCKELPAWGVPVGIGLSVAGSIGINIGQNLQAAGIAHLPEELRTKPFKSKVWQLGMGLFVVFSMVNFAALALAPASILTPIESIQFVTNIAYNKFINHSSVSYKMLAGVVCALLGTVLSVVFGASGEPCFSTAQLEALWSRPAWLVYFGTTVTIAIVTWILHAGFAKKAKSADDGGASTTVVRAVLFTLSSALAGGAQMIVHSKAFSMLLSMVMQGDTAVFTSSWILYVETAFTVLCGIIWVLRQTEGLGLFDPLIILPLLIGTYILFGGVAGGLFFNEFGALHVGKAGYANWALYIAGMCLVVVGLYLIATAGAEQSQKRALEASQEKSRRRSSAADAFSEVSARTKLQNAGKAIRQQQFVQHELHLLMGKSPHLSSQNTGSLMPAPNTIVFMYRRLQFLDTVVKGLEGAGGAIVNAGGAVVGAVQGVGEAVGGAVGGAVDEMKKAITGGGSEEGADPEVKKGGVKPSQVAPEP